ncbi:hypothetical protein ACFYNY_34615 [Streptomyces sp. NPDC006530]|uniref:hypothetical protein n=1 Tax=Streptomyces sp. NPDC006530 TaxID=3364750 RepID=UPI0036CDAA24
MIPFRRVKSLSEGQEWADAGLVSAADMISDNARKSLRDGRWSDAVADQSEGIRRAMKALYDLIHLSLEHGVSFEEMAAESHLSPEYLREAYEGFKRDMWAQAGPGEDGRERWRVLG